MPVLPFGYQVIPNKDEIKGVVVTTVRLDKYEDILGKIGFQQIVNVRIEGRNGIRLSRFPHLMGP